MHTQVVQLKIPWLVTPSWLTPSSFHLMAVVSQAVLGDNTVRLWDAHTGGAIRDPMVGHTNGVISVVFSPNTSRLASYSRDKTVRLWL
jgi:WD40 repeat protein